MSSKQRAGFWGRLWLRIILLIGVGIFLWTGYGWWQKAVNSTASMKDSQIATEVMAEIGRRAPFDLLNLRAIVTGGKVVIDGKVRSNTEREEILKIVREIPGVRSVTGKIELDPTLRTPAEVQGDYLLAVKIKGIIAMEEGLRVFQIKVNNNRGIVTLEGEVPFAEHRSLAERVVRKVKGVKQVINKLSLKK